MNRWNTFEQYEDLDCFVDDFGNVVEFRWDAFGLDNRYTIICAN